jgi:hypothetical protein
VTLSWGLDAVRATRRPARASSPSFTSRLGLAPTRLPRRADAPRPLVSSSDRSRLVDSSRTRSKCASASTRGLCASESRPSTT